MSATLKKFLLWIAAGLFLAAIYALLAFVWWSIAIGAHVPMAFVWGFLAMGILGPLVYARGNQDLPTKLLRLDREERLARLLHFTPGDLDLNRIGRMSSTQRLRLVKSDLGWWSIAVLCIGGPLEVFFGLQSGKAAWDFNFFTQVKLSIVALLVIGVGIWASYRAFTSGVDAIRGSVRSDRTHLHPHIERGVSRSSVYRVRTNDGHDLKLWKATYEQIASEQGYLVYFAPLSKQLISLEDTSSEPGEQAYVVRDRRAPR